MVLLPCTASQQLIAGSFIGVEQRAELAVKPPCRDPDASFCALGVLCSLTRPKKKSVQGAPLNFGQPRVVHLPFSFEPGSSPRCPPGSASAKGFRLGSCLKRRREVTAVSRPGILSSGRLLSTGPHTAHRGCLRMPGPSGRRSMFQYLGGRHEAVLVVLLSVRRLELFNQILELQMPFVEIVKRPLEFIVDLGLFQLGEPVSGRSRRRACKRQASRNWRPFAWYIK